MKLYGSMGSPYVVRAVMAARAKGLSLPLEGPPGGGIKSAEFLRINPLGKMPALDDNGRHLIESMVILDYLDDAYPQSSLLPSNAMDRANVRLLGRLCDLYMMPQTGPLFRNMNPATRTAAEVDAAVATIRKALGDIEYYTSATGPFLAGNTVSQADCAVAPCLQTMLLILGAYGITDLLAATPRLTHWWTHIQADPVCGPPLKAQAEAMRAFMSARR